jgi:hypothetical protein
MPWTKMMGNLGDAAFEKTESITKAIVNEIFLLILNRIKSMI